MADGQEPETLTAETIPAEALGSPNLHEVNENAVAAASARDGAVAAAAEATAQAGLPPGACWPDGKPRVDRNGHTFNPEWHEVNPDGSAVTRRDGKLTIKKGARGASFAASQLPPIEPPKPAQASAPADGAPAASVESPPVAVNYEEVAAGIVDPVLGVVTIVGGADEWDFPKSEREAYRRVATQLCAKYNITTAIPPEVQLAQLMVGSVVARADKPRTAKLLVRLRDWFVRKWIAGDRRAHPEAFAKPADATTPAQSAAAAMSEGGRPPKDAEPTKPEWPAAAPTTPATPVDLQQ